MAIELVLLGAAALLLLSIIASGAWSRPGIPSLLLFLVVGMLAGSEGPGGIHFDDAGAAQSMGVVALVFILFSGGLDTEWKQVRPVLKEGIGLSTAGVLVTALLVGGSPIWSSASPWSKGCCSGESCRRPTQPPFSAFSVRLAQS